VGCPPGVGNSLAVAERFPWPVGWAQIGCTVKYPKQTVFREIRPLSGNFSGMWNHVSRATTWTGVRGKFGGNRSKESGRSGASFTSQKTTPLQPIFSRSLKPIAWFRWKRARLSLFRPQPHLPSFIQIHPSFRDLLAKTTFQIATIYGDRIADNNNLHVYFAAYSFSSRSSVTHLLQSDTQASWRVYDLWYLGISTMPVLGNRCSGKHWDTWAKVFDVLTTGSASPSGVHLHLLWL